MVYTLKEYCQKFKVNNKWVSAKTIERMAKAGVLPTGHIVKKLAGKRGARIIDVQKNV